MYGDDEGSSLQVFSKKTYNPNRGGAAVHRVYFCLQIISTVEYKSSHTAQRYSYFSNSSSQTRSEISAVLPKCGHRAAQLRSAKVIGIGHGTVKNRALKTTRRVYQL